MAAPIKADIIYYRSASDFELEFNLCGYCPMRLLSDKPKDSAAFLRSLGRAVSRSQLIFAVGSIENDATFIPELCSAIGYSTETYNLAAFGIEDMVTLPSGAIPLISSGGDFGGCVIECGPQSIIVLTDNKELRHSICKELVRDYICETAHNINKGAPTGAPEQEKPESAADAPVLNENYTISEKEEVTDFSLIEEDILTEKKERKPRRGLRRLAKLVCILLFLALGAAAYMLFAEPLVIKEIYKDYSDIAVLHEDNSDTVGYLSVSGTDIAYPIVSEVGEGEGYYENHLFNGWYSHLYGTPYIKGDITAQTYYRNIVIYGKAARGGVMFAELPDIATVEGYRRSPTLEFSTLYSSDTYKIFAAFTCEGKAVDDIKKTSFFDDEEFKKHLELLLDLSQIKTTVDVKPNDEIITLIAYGKRDTVVVARRLRAGESALVDTQNATENDGNAQLGLEPQKNNAELLANMQPLGSINYSTYSATYEQASPLSPEKILEYSAAHKKPDGAEISSSASSTITITAENALELCGNKIITVFDTVKNEKVTGTTYDIICRMVEAEMGSTYDKEALKAQTIACYGWLITNGAESNATPLVRLKTASSETCDAVKSVIGLKPYMGNSVAQTMYFPYSAGYTADCSALYSQNFPYLSSTDSSVDRNCLTFTSHRSFKATDIEKWIKEETGINLSAVDKTRWFNVNYDRYGAYAECITFGNTSSIYSGRFLRERVFTVERVGAENTLNSTAYKITYRGDTDTFIFETRGQGHGIGMSQYGAGRLAKSGMNYKEILEHYYKGITLSY